MRQLIILLFVSVIGLAGCTSQPTIPAADMTNRVATKNASTWTLIDWRTPTGVQAVIPDPNSQPISLQFLTTSKDNTAITEGRVSGFAGCNTVQGVYNETADTLTINPLAAGPQVCAPLIMKMEMAFVQRIANIPLQKNFIRNDQGSLLILTGLTGDKWTFTDNPSAIRPIVSVPGVVNRF